MNGGASISWPRERGDLSDVVPEEVTDLNGFIIFIKGGAI
jgi:hypothetical protein